jgi:hypothetical protein
LLVALAAQGCRPKAPSTTPSGALPSVVVDSLRYTTGDFEGCPAEGSGGDSRLNRLKNRDLPPPVCQAFTVDQFVAIHPVLAEGAGPLTRARWSSAELEDVAPWENRGITVEGYLVRAKQQEPESCNCKDKRRRDYHLWLVSGKLDGREQSVIAEVSPRLLPRHPNWKLRILSRLAKDRARVRVSGWMMWDQEHPDQIGKTRGTLWEVHPIHKIEVRSGGRWRDLDG